MQGGGGSAENRAEAIPSEHTLRGILGHAEHSKLFGEFLVAQGEDALGDELLKGEDLSMDTLGALEKQRAEFVSRLERVKSVREGLTTKIIEDAASASPDLQTLLRLGGADAVRTTLVHNLDALAMKNPDKFAAIADAMEIYNAQQTLTAIHDRDIQKLCSDYSISQEEFLNTMQIPGEKERKKKLGELARREYSLFEKARDTASRLFSHSGPSRVDAQDLDRKADLDRLIASIDASVEDVGKALSSSIADNPEHLTAFVNELKGKSSKEGHAKEKEKVFSFKEAGTLLGGRETIEQEWDELCEGRDYKRANPQGKERRRLEFLQNKLGGKKGFWADIAQAFLDELIPTAKKP